MKNEQQRLIEKYFKKPSELLKNEILVAFTPLVHYVARKLAFHHDDLDDLLQVGNIALLRCLERYDISRSIDFSTFATPNIIGEIRHYFRDKNRLIKIPRRLQELHGKIKQAIKVLQTEGKKPTLNELKKILNCSEELILEAMEAGQNSKTISIDTPVFSSDSSLDNNQSQNILSKIGVNNDEDQVLNKETLSNAIYKLPERERRIIYLRFYGGLSQAQIATRLGLSQMHISRLLGQSIGKLKIYISDKK